MIGVYKITSPTNRVYIGQSIDIENRFYLYSINSCHKQRRLYSSLLKYGYDSHKFEVIEVCKISELNKMERHYQEFYNVLSEKGLNCVYQSTEEKRRVISDLMKSKISLANSGNKNGMYGVSHTEEFKEKRRNYKHSKESLSKISERSKGGNNPAAKLVLDQNTGIFYSCVGDAAFTLGVQRDTLKQRLNGRRKNKTSYIYV